MALLLEMKMKTKVISEFFSDDSSKKSIVTLDCNTQCYFVDFFKDKEKIATEFFPGKSIHFVEDAAENYVVGIKDVKCQLKESYSTI